MGYLEDGNVESAEKIGYDDEKRNILLIGDSIRMGYCETVRMDLNSWGKVSLSFSEKICEDYLKV